MPIEINEIAIQMKVSEDAGGSGEGACGTDGNAQGAAEREAIVADCVRRVLQALKAQRER
jgi:hypothetical protein